MSGTHARAFDLPGWPCPPRVRDITNHEDSWGHVTVVDVGRDRFTIAQDELGYLWANGDTVPRFGFPNDNWANPGAIVCWTPDGLGVWVHPKSLRYIASISRLDMEQDKWVPVAVALQELPPFVKDSR